MGGKGKHAKVVAFGDSLTYKSPKLRWPHWLDLLTETFRWHLVNSGVPGNTTAKAMERIQADVLDHRPDLVLVSFGMNDHVMHGKNKPQVGLPQFSQHLAAMADNIRKVGAEPVFVTTHAIVEGSAGEKENYYYNRHDPAFYADVGGALAWLDNYMEAVRTVGSEMGVRVADVRKESDKTDSRQLTTDGVHLSEIGHLVYNKVVSDLLEAHAMGGDPR